MKIATLIMTLSLLAYAEGDDSIGRRCVNCSIPAHSHPQYTTPDSVASMMDERLAELSYSDMKPGPMPVLNPRPRPFDYSHCEMSTWGEHEAINGRCRYYGDVVTGVVNGRVLCSRTQVRCDTDWVLKHIFN